MARQFKLALPPTTGEAADTFIKSLDQQIAELQDQIKLLQSVKAGIQAMFPPHEAWLAGAADA